MIFLNSLLVNNSDVRYDFIEIDIHFCSQILNLFNKPVKYLEGNCIKILDVYNIPNEYSKKNWQKERMIGSLDKKQRNCKDRLKNLDLNKNTNIVNLLNYFLIKL